MNLYDLEKKAFMANAWEPLDGNAVAMLANHCRNNFLRTLAALKRLAAVADGEYPATDDRHPDNDGTNKLIAELEEVS